MIVHKKNPRNEYYELGGVSEFLKPIYLILFMSLYLIDFFIEYLFLFYVTKKYISFFIEGEGVS
jgi:hypothetical protein